MKDNWNIKDIPKLEGKTIIVTGANSGIGFEATKIFASKGAKVIMGCRNIKKSEQAKKDILSEFPNAELFLEELDLSSFESIKNFSSKINNEYKSIDILLNNAGIMTTPYGPTKDGIEQQIGVNHFGHYYLTMSLLKLITSTPHSRIVNIASIAHKFGSLNPKTFLYKKGNRYNKSKAYSQSKLANLLFTYKLQNELEVRNIDTKVLAAHPGISRTNLGRHIKALQFKEIEKLFGLFNQTQAQGSRENILESCTRIGLH